jgi:hypothetical protein
MTNRRALFSAVALFTACGGSSGNNGNINNLPSEVIKAQCGFAVKCGLMPDEATCEAATATPEELATTVADVNAGTVKFNSDKLQKCLDDFSGLDCTSIFLGNGSNSEEDCAAVFTGTVALNGACFTDEECVSESCNIPNCGSACCAGTCQPKPQYVADGGDCSGGMECVDGDYCFFDSAAGTSTCDPLVADGQPCTQGGACVDGDICVQSASGGTCSKPLAIGATCDPQALGACGFAYCDTTTTKCTALGKAGDACSDTAPCELDNQCDATSGKCVARVGAGGTCDPSAAQCLGDLTCDQTSLKCTLTNPAACK